MPPVRWMSAVTGASSAQATTVQDGGEMRACVHDVKQIFSDSSPLVQRDLNEETERFIVGWRAT